MKNAARRQGLAMAVLVAWVGCSGDLEASFVTYTESAIVQGSLGQQGFDSLVTLNLTADTGGITQSGAYHYTAKVTTATVTVDGMTATFLDPVYFFSGNNFGGFTDVSPATMSGVTLLDIDNPGFSGYDLATPLGPLNGLSGGFGGTFSTTLGILDLGLYSGNGTFTAILAAVPEPSSLAMSGIAGVAGLLVARLRRKRLA